MEPDGRWALVTGGGPGIGSGIVRQLARAAADVGCVERWGAGITSPPTPLSVDGEGEWKRV